MVFMLFEAPPYAGKAWKKVETGMTSIELTINCTKLCSDPMPVDYFNATMTYRNDSDYPLPYGKFVRRTPLDKEQSFFTENQVILHAFKGWAR
ncbi:hypothetical protein COOONC_19642 [Cooperia oncophora]